MVVGSTCDGGRVAEAGRRSSTHAAPDSALAVAADVGTEAGNVALIEAADDRVRPDRPVLRQRRRRHRARLDTPEEEWELAFDVNVHAHRWAAKHLLPGWLARGEGYFCSTASAPGLLSQIGSAPYTLTKHAAVAFAEWLSITYGDAGVRVSCLCPQGVNTNMLQRRRRPGRRDRPAASCAPPGVVLEPADVAEVVVARSSATRRSSSCRTRRCSPTCNARPATTTAGSPACASCRRGCRTTDARPRIDRRRASARSTARAARRRAGAVPQARRRPLVRRQDVGRRRRRQHHHLRRQRRSTQPAAGAGRGAPPGRAAAG